MVLSPVLKLAESLLPQDKDHLLQRTPGPSAPDSSLLFRFPSRCQNTWGALLCGYLILPHAPPSVLQNTCSQTHMVLSACNLLPPPQVLKTWIPLSRLLSTGSSSRKPSWKSPEECGRRVLDCIMFCLPSRLQGTHPRMGRPPHL